MTRTLPAPESRRRWPRGLTVGAVFGVLLAAAVLCGPAGAGERPGSDALLQHLGMQLPAYWQVDEVTVTAEVNEGDAIDPQVRQRFQATVSSRDVLYLSDPATAVLPPPYVRVMQSLEAGARRALYGTTRARLEREHASARQAAQAEHTAELAALERRHEQALERAAVEHDRSLKALRADHEQRLAIIEAEFEQAAEALRAQTRAAVELKQLEEKRLAAQAELGDVRRAALARDAATRTQALQAITEALAVDVAAARRAALLTALEQEETALREHALRQVLQSDDEVLRPLGIRAALAAQDPVLRDAAIDAALGADSASLRALAVITLLRDRTSLMLPVAGDGEAIMTLSELVVDPETATLTGKLGGDGHFARCGKEAVSGTVAASGIGLAGARCNVDIRIGDDGMLTGSFVAQNRYRHEVVGRLR